jgi:hypothetical protein
MVARRGIRAGVARDVVQRRMAMTARRSGCRWTRAVAVVGRLYSGGSRYGRGGRGAMNRSGEIFCWSCEGQRPVV